MVYIDVNAAADPNAISMLRDDYEELGLDAVEHLYRRMEDTINDSQFILVDKNLTRLPEDFGKVSVIYKSRRDYDEDGLRDNVEINLKAGEVTYKDRDMLKLPKLDEKITVITGFSMGSRLAFRFSETTGDKIVSFLSQFKVLDTISNPLEKDSDGDGIEDVLDASPYLRMDDYFVVADCFEKEYIELVPNITKTKVELGEELYKTKPPHKFPLDNFMSGFWGIASLYGLMLTEFSLPNATEALQYYMLNMSNRIYYYEDFREAIIYTHAQRYSYYNAMNIYMDMVEKNVLPDNEYIFMTSPNKCFTVSFGEYKKAVFDLDWFLAVGGGENVILSKVECKENLNGTRSYKADVKYYLFDYYDWNPNEFIQQKYYEMHLMGLAHSFLAFGVYETTVEWEACARYPDYTYLKSAEGVAAVDILNVKFEGIQDSGLKLY